MRAIGVIEYGGPDALREIDVPAEALGPNDVRLRVSAAAVNPTDTMVRNGARAEGRERSQGPGDVPGMDVSGTVVEVGDAVTSGVAVGERVMGVVVPSGAHGGYRDDLVLPAASVAVIPPELSDAEAATLPMNGLTARMSLDALGLEAGQVLAVTGAAGAYGGYVIELAKAHGLTVVADAKPDDEELVRSLGADVVVPRGDDVAQAIREAFPDGVHGLADGAVQDAAVLDAVAEDGAVATVRGYQGDGRRNLHVHPVLVRDVAERTDWLEELRDLAVEGRLTPRVAEVLPATQAGAAHARLEAGGVRGRLVLDLS